MRNTFSKYSGIGRVLLMCLLIGLESSLGGCASAIIGAGATAGTAAMQERGFKTAVSDTALHAKIDAAYLVNKVNFLRVAIDVHEGRVLLTGSTPKTKDRIEAVRLAWTVEGVKEVINEISVRNSSGLMDAARDHWISAQLRVKIIFDSTINAINYTIDTVNGTVYLLGIAQDATELQRVRAHARALDYVRRVISHVRVKS